MRVDLDQFPVWAELVPEIQMNNLPEYVEKGKIRAMVIFGGNAKMWPQPQLYQKAIGKLEFSVAADYFYRPWTHDYVDLLLPAATCFERLASVASFGRSIYQRQPIKPLGEAREDWQIIADMGVALGLSEEFFGGNLEALINEYLKSTGVTVEQLRKAPGSMVTIPLSEPPKSQKYAVGMLRKDKKPGFNTPTGKVEVFSTILKKYGVDPLPTYKEPVESPVSKPELAKQYPLVLMTGARIPFYTHTKWRDVPWVSEFQPEPVVNLDPSDAKSRGIKEGDRVILKNPYGQIKVKAHLTEMVTPGIVDIYHGWPAQDVNTMVTRYFDPISGFPPYKSGLCEVKKAAV
jgi:anaerobic selenocysteine-containing dehydrogenase